MAELLRTFLSVVQVKTSFYQCSKAIKPTVQQMLHIQFFKIPQKTPNKIFKSQNVGFYFDLMMYLEYKLKKSPAARRFLFNEI